MIGRGSEPRGTSCEDLYATEPGMVELGSNVSPEEARLAAALQRAGIDLPFSPETGEIRIAMIQQVTAARNAAVAVRGGTVRAGTRSRPLRAFAFTAVAMASVLLVMLSVSFASLHAMPGNPLYSVKRVVESAGLVVSSGHSRVDRRLSQAETRMRELEYVRARGMTLWFLPLVRDTESDIDEVKREAAELDSRSERDADERAGNIVIDNEESVREALPSMPAQERGSVEQWLDKEKDDREKLDGEGAVPAPGAVLQPGSQPEGDGGRTYSPPTGQLSPDTSGSEHVGDTPSSQASPSNAVEGRSPDNRLQQSHD